MGLLISPRCELEGIFGVAGLNSHRKCGWGGGGGHVYWGGVSGVFPGDMCGVNV